MNIPLTHSLHILTLTVLMHLISSSRQKIRMGASALMSALNAIPWEDDEDDDGSSSDEDDNRDFKRMGGSIMPQKASRPKGKAESIQSSY